MYASSTGRVRGELVPPDGLLGFDVEDVRVAAEYVVADRVRSHPRVAALRAEMVPSRDQEIRRRLLAGALRLTDTMAPAAFSAAREAARRLSVAGQLEIYQRNGGENAAIHLVEAPILLEIQGRLLPLLDHDALLGLFGHELGHYLAHGPWGALGEAHGLKSVLGLRGIDEDLESDLLELSMLAELTADRVGLLACGDLHAMLRLEMITLTGLPSDALTWDTEAYLAQSVALMEECLASGDPVYGGTHPEHSLRAFALFLFSQTDVFKELTGRGPGSRLLEDVDDLLSRFFQGRERAASMEPGLHLGDEPPRELHECALAASVLVAFSDGELADEEAEAIERIFAPLVGDWAAYLDVSVATRRFRETAPVVAAAGSDLLRALFNLLVHVMGADGVVDPREVGAIRAVGDALGCGEQYRRLLMATLGSLDVHVEVLDGEHEDLPLPVTPTEVEDAFEAFLAGVGRRGEAVITLRRLMRLMGGERRDERLIARAKDALRRAEIEADRDLAEVSLDERVHLLSLTAYVEEVGAPPADDQGESTAGLKRALVRMRDLLVSGDGRSPSVRLRRLRKGRTFDLCQLDRISVGSAERALAKVRAGKSASLVKASEAGQQKAALQCANDLKTLARAHRSQLEETGANDLYVGYPLITGNVAPAGSSASSTYYVRAPLVLIPVDLVETSKGARGFQASPRKDEAPIVNQSLLRLLFNKKGYAYSDELSDELDALAGDPGAGVDAVIAKLAEVGVVTARLPGALSAFRERDDEAENRGSFLEVEECALLGLFPQSSSDLLQDYDGLIADLSRPRQDVGGLLSAGAALLPDSLNTGLERPTQGDAAPDGAVTPVIEADPSQRQVVARCRRSVATVIDGPPGTGKSQVIVNLVADALTRGERVAVVCEKRAALDVVYQRLEKLGLKHLVGLVHDVNDDRKALYEQIGARLEEEDSAPLDEALLRQNEARHADCQRALGERDALLARRPDGLSMTLGELAAAAADTAASLLPEGDVLARLSLADLERLQLEVADLHALQTLWGEGSAWRAPRGRQSRTSLAGWTDDDRASFSEALRLARDAAVEHERLLERSPVAGEKVEASRRALSEVRERRASWSGQPALFGALLRGAVDEPVRLRAAADARAAWEEASTAIVRCERPVQMQVTPELRGALAVLKRWSSSWLRFFVWGWWASRRVLRQALEREWPDRAADPVTTTLVDSVMDRAAASEGWRRITTAAESMRLRALLPSEPRPVGEFVSTVAGLADGASRLLEARASLVAAEAWPALDDPEPLAAWDRTIDARCELLDAREHLRGAMKTVRSVLPWMVDLPAAEEMEALRRTFERDGARIIRTDQRMDACRRLGVEPLEILDQLQQSLPNAEAFHWRRALVRTWAEARLRGEERGNPLLQRIGTEADDVLVEQQVGQLAAMERELADDAVERVLHRASQASLLQTAPPEKYQRRTEAQKTRELLLKEARKKRRLMPLRSFVRRFASDGLLDVVPVWLLSPESVAILFPREPLFDLVVFDEASQCTVEAGFPVLLRAKRVVVAGDEKQMPPSSYFSLGGGDEDEPAPSDDSERELRDMLSAESLLTLARTRVPHAGLSWHYRCRHEALIAFSNHAMYHGSLLTIPATAGPAAASSIRWVEVPDGSYDRGENRPEAEKVVDLLHELLSRDSPPSVGVITFNLRQRRAIYDAVDSRVERDPEFDALWQAAHERGVDERPFIKNLEQVQGDERDATVFSLGHAPQPRMRKGEPTGQFYVPARFGPLGQRGGERRLNVAISRAKQECWIVSSFDPSLLNVKSAKNQGPVLFKRFLEFAQSIARGQHLSAEQTLDRVREARRSPHHGRRTAPFEGYAPLVTQIALELEAAGVPHALDVGSSDFRVPLAIADPQDPHRFVLAVFPDEGEAGQSAYDRYVHRPAVLRMRGWEVLRVSAVTWWRRRQDVIDAIIERVPGSRGAIDNEVYRALREKPVAPVAVARVSEQTAPYETTSAETEAEPDLPSWALGVDSPAFRKALLHLHAHGLLTEVELVNMVGGPRRARRFTRALDGLRSSLPFGVEVADANGSKVYRVS